MYLIAIGRFLHHRKTSITKTCPARLRRALLVMKLTTILLIVTMLRVSATGFAQSVSLSEKNVRLESVFKKIEKQTGYYFWYENKALKEARKVTVQLQNATLEEALDKCLAGMPFDYTIIEKTIVIKTKRSGRTQQQQNIPPPIEVRGKVLDETGAPLQGATVKLKGSEAGTSTGTDGNFTLSLSNNQGTIVISFIGYQNVELPVSADLGTIMLQREITAADEIVVIGYGAQKKSDLTGAISSIKADNLPKAATPNVEQMLAGKAAGVQIRANDAQPGAAVEVLIRGAASTGAGNEPLYIVDGFPLSGGADPGTGTRYSIGSRSPLNSINPNDIESIEILKDASATAIYGARAANGVILITTKSGKQGKAKVSFDMKNSFQNVMKPWDMMNASQWMQARTEYLKERWMLDNKIGVYGNVDPSTVDPFTPPYTDQEINNAGAGTNWINEVTRTGKIQEQNISISGASDKTNYLISFNHFDQKGIVKANDFKRFTGRVNITQTINSWIKAGVKATGSKIDINNPAIGTGIAENTGVLEAALKFTPSLPVRLADGSYSIVPNSTFFPNPVSLLEISNNTQQNRLMVQTFAEFEPVKNLKIRTQLGFDKQEGLTNIYLPKSTMYGDAVGGQANINQNNRFDQLFNTTISYGRKLGTAHQLDALVGYEWQSMGTSGHNLGNNKFPTDAFLTNNIGSGESSRPSVGSYKGVNELASYFGRINYNLLGKYLVTLTMRADGSSRFGEGNRFGYFPSGAVAWRLDQEDFLQNLSWLSTAKLRFSAGQTGNSNISGAFAFYSFGSDYLFGNSVNAGTYLSSYANPYLRWETTTEYNLGIDLGLFNNRINITGELFSKVVSDLLGNRQLKTYLPLDRVAANLGKTSSKGFEVTVNTRNLVGAFTWSTDVMLSAYRDRWKERSPDVVLRSYESATDPIRVNWGYVLDGFVQPGEVIPHMPGALPGTQKIKDINGYDDNNQLTGKPDGKLNDADVVKIGNVDPSLIFGFGNTFAYKNFDLNIHIYGMLGIKRNNDYLGYVTDIYPNINRGWNIPNMLDQFWSSENQNGKYPNPYVVSPFPGSQQYLLQKADFARVRNITLGYTFTDLQKNKRWFSDLRIYVDAANPVIFTSFKGIDPEITPKGNPPIRSIYPPARSYTLGLNVSF